MEEVDDARAIGDARVALSDEASYGSHLALREGATRAAGRPSSTVSTVQILHGDRHHRRQIAEASNAKRRWAAHRQTRLKTRHAVSTQPDTVALIFLGSIGGFMALLSVPAVRLPVAAGAATYVVASTACYCMRRGSLHSLRA